MSMVWMQMPGQSWTIAAATFLGMWVVMMVAMMLPSLVPTLLSYRRSVQGREIRLGRLTALAAAGYFMLWAVLGMALYGLGVALVAAQMRWPWLSQHVPLATSAALLLAGSFQFTPWKAGHLKKCRNARACSSPMGPNARHAWRQGLTWGVDCGLCCFGFMAVLIVTGVMNLAAMIILATTITAERLLPRPHYTSRAAGVLIVAMGIFGLVQTLHN